MDRYVFVTMLPDSMLQWLMLLFIVLEIGVTLYSWMNERDKEKAIARLKGLAEEIESKIRKPDEE